MYGQLDAPKLMAPTQPPKGKWLCFILKPQVKLLYKEKPNNRSLHIQATNRGNSQPSNLSPFQLDLSSQKS
jgi:hypothetical protein